MLVQKRYVLVLGLLAAVGCGKTKSTDELIGDLNSTGSRADHIGSYPASGKGRSDKDRAGADRRSQGQGGRCRNRGAALKLGSFGEQAKDAIPALQTAPRNRDARVRESAGIALSHIDPAQFPLVAKLRKK